MIRKFWEAVIYDYTTKEEAEKHREVMRNKGWSIKQDVYDNGGDVLKYSVEYQKQR